MLAVGGARCQPFEGGCRWRRALRGEGRFDPTEDRSLFVANVLTKQLAELVEDFGFGVGRALELGDSSTEVGVLGQDALDVSVVRAGVFRQGGKEQFLFEAKVFDAFGAPEVERRLPDGVGLSLVGSLKRSAISSAT